MLQTLHGAPPFVERFAAAWASGDADELVGLLHADVELRQPLIPPLRGHDEARTSLARVVDAIPGLAVDVIAWAQAGSTVFIEFALRGEGGVRLPMLDRFELRGDRAAFRLNYQGLSVIAAQLARDPRRATRLLRAGARPRGTGGGLPEPAHAAGATRRIAERVARPRLRAGAPQRLAVSAPSSGAGPARHYFTSPAGVLLARRSAPTTPERMP